MEPYRPRPETTAAVARSLVTGALGLKSNLTREQRDQERKKLKEAKGKSGNCVVVKSYFSNNVRMHQIHANSLKI